MLFIGPVKIYFVIHFEVDWQGCQRAKIDDFSEEKFRSAAIFLYIHSTEKSSEQMLFLISNRIKIRKVLSFGLFLNLSFFRNSS